MARSCYRYQKRQSSKSLNHFRSIPAVEATKQPTTTTKATRNLAINYDRVPDLDILPNPTEIKFSEEALYIRSPSRTELILRAHNLPLHAKLSFGDSDSNLVVTSLSSLPGPGPIGPGPTGPCTLGLPQLLYSNQTATRGQTGYCRHLDFFGGGGRSGALITDGQHRHGLITSC